MKFIISDYPSICYKEHTPLIYITIIGSIGYMEGGVGCIPLVRALGSYLVLFNALCRIELSSSVSDYLISIGERNGNENKSNKK